MTAGACDANCCCDAACSAAEVARFRAASACLPEGPRNLTLRKCIDLDADSALVYINPKYRMSLERVPGMERVLCVAVDNNPTLGGFLDDPGVGSGLFSRSDANPTYSFETSSRTTATATATQYNIGDNIPAAVFSGALRSGFGGNWVIPAADDAGECTLIDGGGAAVRYRQNVAATQCMVTAPLSAATCEALSGVRRVRTLRVGTAPHATPFDATLWATPTVDAVVRVVPPSGNITVLAAAGSGAGAGFVDAAAFDAATCTCTNAAVGAAFRVSYAGEAATITGVSVDVMLATISQPVATCGSVPLAVPLSTSVAFVPDAATVAASALTVATNDLDASERSGAPGYVVGKPVLAGALVAASGADPTSPAATDRVAIVRSSASDRTAVFAAGANATGAGTSLMGLYVRGPSAAGACIPTPAATATVGSDEALSVPIAFGEDAVFGCSLSFTPAEFAAACAGSPDTMLTYVGLGTVDPGTGSRVPITHIGIFGNSDIGKAWQWLAIDKPAALPARASYDTTNALCSGMTSGISIEILTARVGEKHNPQRKIVGARLQYASDTWRYRREDVRTAGATSQAFTLTTAVTWTELTPVSQDYIPPAPPVVPPLPSDLFYPFVSTWSTSDRQLTVSAAPGAIGPSTIAVIIAGLSAMLLAAGLAE